ncbi:MAG: hypothetical protein ACNYZG_06650 [Gammaproteobacteria bacterium]
MNKKALLLFILMITVALPGTSVMAEILFMRDVNSACNTDMDPTVITVECSSCHNLDDFDKDTQGQDKYEHDGAVRFAPPTPAVLSSVLPQKNCWPMPGIQPMITLNLCSSSS